MKILIDSAIPYIKGVLEPYFEVTYKLGSDISSSDLSGVVALFIRTRTRCDRELLEGSSVKFIGTATIGMDHIDIDYCLDAGIKVSNAAGCNARAVAQWVCAAIIEQDRSTPILPYKTTIGVVGVGSVGSVVVDLFDKMGFIVLKNDPIRADREPDFYSSPLDDLLQKSDFLTFHTPLTHWGCYPTFHLLGRENIKLLNPNVTVLNSSRGGVVDEEALLDAYNNSRLNNMIIDVWEHEPNINRELLSKSVISTPHIAGYSIQGKANATSMIVGEICEFFDIPSLANWYPSGVNMVINPAEINWANIKRLMALYYDISSDTTALKCAAERFEQLRDEYKYRDEFF